MIISASYKTDIPAFYGEWFMNRLKAGYCRLTNPFNRSQAMTVSLRRESVDGIVFWTKNLGPFVDHLRTIRDLGFPFIVQYSINAYPRTLEFSVVNHERSIDHMRMLAGEFAPGVGVWRYDPIVFSSLTSRDFHRDNFARLAKALEGTTDEVVLSFAQVYKKTKRNMDWAARKFCFSWRDPLQEEKLKLLGELSTIAATHGFRTTLCSQPEFLVPGVGESMCVDAPRLMRLWNISFKSQIKGNRPGCMCAGSKDIGDYDTCPHGCVYCYAVMNRELAKTRYKRHDPLGEFLFTTGNEPSNVAVDLFH